jgi:hypothetical protein
MIVKAEASRGEQSFKVKSLSTIGVIRGKDVWMPFGSFNLGSGPFPNCLNSKTGNRLSIKGEPRDPSEKTNT